MIQDLLTEWDAAMTEVMADPVAAEADQAHPARVALGELFTADSPYIGTFGELLNAYINQDVGRLEPGPSGVVQQTTFLDFTIASDEEPDHVSFTFCSFDDSQGVSLSTGDERPPGVAIVQGAGEAERIDGVWLLHRLRELGRVSEPVGTANPCPDYAVETDQ